MQCIQGLTSEGKEGPGEVRERGRERERKGGREGGRERERKGGERERERQREREEREREREGVHLKLLTCVNMYSR